MFLMNNILPIRSLSLFVLASLMLFSSACNDGGNKPTEVEENLVITLNPDPGTAIDAPITESMINNYSILVYARKSGSEETSVFPATIYDSNNDYELLHATYDMSGIQIFHTKNTGGVYARPENNTLRFRYILIERAVADNGRPDLSEPEYSMTELQSMSYQEVLAALNIPE